MKVRRFRYTLVWLVSTPLAMVAIALRRFSLDPKYGRWSNWAMQKLVLWYLQDFWAPLLAEYTDPTGSTQLTEGDPQAPARVWICWWQGLEAAPELVKACHDAMRRNAVGAEVVVVTSANVADYVTIDPAVLARFGPGGQPPNYLSDVLRMGLLATNGGLWADATIFTSTTVPAHALHGDFFTWRHPARRTYEFVPEGRWAGFLIGGRGDTQRTFEFVFRALSKYWKYHPKPLNYFLIDYAVHVAYEANIAGFQSKVAQISFDGPDLYEMVKRLGEPFDAELYASWLERGSCFFKLDRRFAPASSNAEVKTFFDYVVSASGRVQPD